MNIRNWLARENTYLNYLREDYIDWSAVPQYEINSLIYWATKSSSADVHQECMRTLQLSPIDYIKYLGDVEIDIAKDALRQYGRQYELGAIQDSKLEEEYNETI